MGTFCTVGCISSLFGPVLLFHDMRSSCTVLQSPLTPLLPCNYLNPIMMLQVHVPALKPKPMAAGEKLMPIASLPDWAQPAFESMKELNRVQVGRGSSGRWACKGWSHSNDTFQLMLAALWTPLPHILPTCPSSCLAL